MADRSMDFTGNNDWPNVGKAIDPSDHPATNMPDATDHHDGTVLGTDGYETARQVNAGPKANKGGDADPYPNTDDNMFTASGRDSNIIRAKRQLRDGMR